MRSPEIYTDLPAAGVDPRPGRGRRTAWLVLVSVALVGAGYVLAGRAGAFRLSLDELRARYAAQESKHLTVQGIELHYRDEGRGPADLLLPGSFGTLRQYDDAVMRGRRVECRRDTLILRGTTRLRVADRSSLPRQFAANTTEALPMNSEEAPNRIRAQAA